MQQLTLKERPRRYVQDQDFDRQTMGEKERVRVKYPEKREELAPFLGENIMIHGNPSDEYYLWQEGRQLWFDCQIICIDYEKYDFHRYQSQVQTLLATDPTHHLWINYNCFMVNALPLIPIEGKFCVAIGKVAEYQRLDGSFDYCITPVSVPEMLDLCIQFFVMKDLLCLAKLTYRRTDEGGAWAKRHKVLQRTENLLDHYKGEFTTIAEQSEGLYRRVLAIVSDHEARKESRQKREAKRLKSHKGFGCPT